MAISFFYFTLLAIIILPFIGAIFLLFIPSEDAELRRRFSLFVILTTFIFHIKNSIPLLNAKPPPINLFPLNEAATNSKFHLRLDYLSFTAILFLLATVFLLIFCKLGKSSKAFSRTESKALFILGLTSAGFLFENFGFFILVQFAVVQMILIMNLDYGGPHRSSSTLVAGIFFTVIDLAAFFVWSWQSDLALWVDSDFLAVATILPFLTRLLVPFLAPWSRHFFANSTVEITILYLCSSFLAGAVGLAHLRIESPFFSELATVAACFAALLAITDRPMGQFLVRVAAIGGALVAALLTHPQSSTLVIRTLAFSGSLILVISLALFFQRALREDESDNLKTLLLPLWILTLTMLTSTPFLGVGAFIWEIFPINFPAWIATFLLLTIALSFQIRAPLLQKGILTRATRASKISNYTLTNAFMCLVFVFGTIAAVQILFLQLGQSS